MIHFLKLAAYKDDVAVRIVYVSILNIMHYILQEVLISYNVY